ncbi:hypothetical protein EVAR_79999_1 [Eumeta japonica]|uniref:Uncharacterized protein n=1 Tax=Eumeta variegata TaxID=151549 RepID=A0A4C1WP58_EUMVA|nr:hypothetical protein EVAR_79999_1 [Eumeta japonica]
MYTRTEPQAQAKIVEEQRCHDHVFRLTCRDLDTHIAVLEAWYTATRDLFNLTDFMQSSPPTISRRDAELDQVFVYSSPRHDGFYETTNRSLENATRWDVDANETINDVRSVSVNTSASESYRTVSRAFASETLNISCGVQPYVKSYASWKHKGKILQMPRDSSINLRAPVSYR